MSGLVGDAVLEALEKLAAPKAKEGFWALKNAKVLAEADDLHEPASKPGKMNLDATSITDRTLEVSIAGSPDSRNFAEIVGLVGSYKCH